MNVREPTSTIRVSWWRRIGARLLAVSLTAIGCVAALSGWLTFSAMERQGAYVQFILDNREAETVSASLQHQLAKGHARMQRALLLTSMGIEETDFKALAKELDVNLSAVQRRFARSAQGLDAIAQHATLTRRIEKTLDDYKSDLNLVLDLAAVDAVMAILAMTRSEESFQSLFEAVQSLRRLKTEALDSGSMQFLEQNRKARNTALVTASSMLIVAVWATVFLLRRITGPLRELTRTVQQAKEDQGVDLSHLVSSRDEMGMLATAFTALEKERSHAHAALKCSNATLERQVKERTESFFLVNEKLIQEIEERKAIDDQLRRSVQEHRDVLEGSLQGVFMHCDGEICYANKAFAEMLGYSSVDQILSEAHLWRIVHTEDRERLIAYERARLRGGEPPIHYTFRAIRRDRSIVSLLTSARVIKWNEQIVVQGFCVDITAREEARVAMELARDEAMKATRMKAEFLANMSHEIRTPMNGVIGALSLLNQTALDQNQRQYTDVARVSGTALLSLIDDILDFSKIEAGKLKLEQIEFSPREVVEDVIDIMAERASERGVRLECTEYPSTPKKVIGDPYRMRQIIINLVSNAVKFTFEGSVRVVLRAQENSQGECTLRVDVADSGIGMTDETKARIFEPFVQEDGSTTRRFGGTGLGLAICSELVGLMDGAIDVRSSEGVGTTFSLSIPLRVIPQQTTSRLLEGQKILIWSDDEDLYIDLRTQLECHLGAEIVDLNSQQRSLPVAIAVLTFSNAEVSAIKEILTRFDDTRIPIAISNARDIDVAELGAFGKHEVVALRRPMRVGALADTLLRQLALPGQASCEEPHMIPSALVSFPLESVRVLVVDDVGINRMLAAKMLEKLGAAPQCARNGQEALEMLNSEPFDIVLMDCQMPTMDGYEATEAIREQRDSIASIPIIAITAHAMKGDDERCFAAGMDDYISKPLAIEGLVGKISYWKEHRHKPRPLTAA